MKYIRLTLKNSICIVASLASSELDMSEGTKQKQ
jgi:hypothetical protein